MKQVKFYMLTMVSLLAVACSDGKDEPAAIQQPGKADVTDSPGVQTDGEPIGFSAELEEQADTRANLGNTIVYGLSTPFHDGIESQSQLQDLGFGVYGFYTGQWPMSSATNIEDKEIVMLNQKVTCSDKTNNKWTYSPLRFWPGSMNYMSFFAYAPYGDFTPTIGDGDGATYAKQTEGTMANTYTFLADNPVTAPTYDWDIDDQVDVLWGMNSNTGFPFKDIHRSGSNNGTLNWKFKHALARVRFSIYNYMNIFGAYDNVATGIKGDENGYVYPKINGVSGEANKKKIYDPVATQYVGTGTDDELSGWYAFLHEERTDGLRETNFCHKFEFLGEGSRRLVVTEVSLKNMVTNATLTFDNSDGEAWIPLWQVNNNKTTFVFPGTLLNSKFFSNNIGSVTSENWDSQPELNLKEEPLVDLDNLGKVHYLLMVPTTNLYDNDNIVVSVKYKVISKFKLVGNYTWDSSSNYPPREARGLGTYELTGVSVPDGDAYEVNAPLNIEFKANHSYHVKLRMGDMLQILFEVTDWDEIHDVYVPSFE